MGDGEATIVEEAVQGPRIPRVEKIRRMTVQTRCECDRAEETREEKRVPWRDTGSVASRPQCRLRQAHRLRPLRERAWVLPQLRNGTDQYSPVRRGVKAR